MIAERKAAGELSPASHPRTRPPYLEAEAVSRLLRIAQAADAPVVIVHLTNREALLEVDHARKRGQTVYVETCPQYLLLDESVYFNEDYSAAARYVCAPPLRDKAEQEHLWKGLRRGAIQTVSTDHCSFTLAQKDMGREDFTKIPGGLPAWRPGRAAVLLRRGQAEDQRRPDVPGAQRESRSAVWSLSPEGRAAARQRRGHRGLRPRRQPCDPSGGLRGQCGLQPL